MYPRFVQRLFENEGAGPLLRKEIIPAPAAIGAASASDLEALESRLGEQNTPLATPDTPGIVRVGHGLDITPDSAETESDASAPPGVLSLAAHAAADPAVYGRGDSLRYGHVRIVDNFEEELAAADGVAISPRGVKKAWDRLFGLTEGQTFTTSGSWTVPETGQYTVTCIGGGGNGGNGGTGAAVVWRDGSDRYYTTGGGGGGGGGGAGQVVTRKMALTKGEVINFIVGGPGGATVFKDLVAQGGGHGGAGANGNQNGAAAGGAAGLSYGSMSYAGTAGAWASTYGSTAIRDGTYFAGGQGSAGGISLQSPYGDGGHGGNGAGMSWSYTYYSTLGTHWGGAGSAGTAGTQGCIIIASPIGA